MVLNKCLGDGCAPEDEIDQIITDNGVKIGLINSYFDLDNIDNPIQTFYEDTNFCFNSIFTIFCEY